MKSKIIIFSLILIMSLSLVCAFESKVYNIGVDVPAEEDEETIVDVDVPIVTTRTRTSSRSPSNVNPINNSPDLELTGDTIHLDTTGDEKNDSTSGELEQERKKGFFPRMTGAVIGTVGKTGAIAIPVFVFGILGAFVFIKFKKRKK